MNIEHIAMYVNDLEAARDFFVKYFDAAAGALYHNPKTKFRSYFLNFSDGARLEIISRPEVEDNEKKQFRTGYAHIAFSVGSAERVDELTRKLAADGYEISGAPRRTGDGYYESCVIGFEGNTIEITI